MATAVYTSEEVVLNDGETVVTLKPLNIKRLREFMKIVQGEMTEADGEIAVLNAMVKACDVALRPQIGDKDIEDLLDMPTITRVFDICGGIKLEDPNLVMAAAALNGQI